MPKDYRRVQAERLEAVKARLRRKLAARDVELAQHRREMVSNSVPAKRRTKLRGPITKYGKSEFLRRAVQEVPSGGWAGAIGQIYCGPDRKLKGSPEDREEQLMAEEIYRAQFLMRGTRLATEAVEARLRNSARNSNTTHFPMYSYIEPARPKRSEVP